MTKDLLDDDFDWNNISDDLNNENDSAERQPVVMLHTFNTEEQAQLVAAILRVEGIDAHVVSATTGQLTPFAYGNVRLYVAQSQQEKAKEILKEFNARQDIYEEPQLSAGRILIIVIVGIFIIGLVLRLIQVVFGYF